jgi:hypothetical protein
MESARNTGNNEQRSDGYFEDHRDRTDVRLVQGPTELIHGPSELGMGLAHELGVSGAYIART